MHIMHTHTVSARTGSQLAPARRRAMDTTTRVVTYPDEAVVEVQPEQRGGDGGHAADVLPDEVAHHSLHAGAALGVEPHPQLPARAGRAAGQDDDDHGHSKNHRRRHGHHPAAAVPPPGAHRHCCAYVADTNVHSITWPTGLSVTLCTLASSRVWRRVQQVYLHKSLNWEGL